MNPVYLDTARLVTQVAPFVFADGAFALKGGNALRRKTSARSTNATSRA